jgi:hypothetical protein
MSVQAMKQALEALENALEIIPRAGHSAGMQRHAADALRQSIAEAENQPVHASDMSQERVDETTK